MFKSFGTLNFLENGLIYKEISDGIFQCYECRKMGDGGMYELRDYYINTNVDDLDYVGGKKTKEEILFDVYSSYNTNRFSNTRFYTGNEIYEMFHDKVPEDIIFDSHVSNYWI